MAANDHSQRFRPLSYVSACPEWCRTVSGLKVLLYYREMFTSIKLLFNVLCIGFILEICKAIGFKFIKTVSKTSAGDTLGV